MLNHIKTMFLMIILTVILMVAGELLLGEGGLIIAFGIALVMNFFAYWYSDKMAITMTRSRPLKESEGPEVYGAVRKLAENSNMPMPRIYLMPTDQPNAFAAGRNPSNSVVAVTQGLVRMLNQQELEGVLAHEMAHIRNRDILVSTMAAIIAGALMMISRLGMYGMMFGGRREGGHPIMLIIKLAALILAPLAAILIRMAISRTREYQADSTGAVISGNPEGLASALQKMENHARKRPLQVNEAASHMFIVNPLSAKGLSGLFSTHPPIQERVKRLRSMNR